MTTKTESLPAAIVPAAGPGTLETIDLHLIEPSKTNPRKYFEEIPLQELAASIKDHGVISPIVVRALTNGKGGKYELVAGERRVRASKIAGAHTIPAIVATLDDKQVLEIQVIENLQRTDLSPMEEARGYEQLVHKHGYTPAVLAAKVAKGESYIRKRMQLAQLDPKVQKSLEMGELPLGHALLVARIPDGKLQIEVLTIAKRDGASVKGLAKIISERFMLVLTKAPFDITDKILVPAAGSCTDCPHRTGNQKELFDDVKGADICTKPTCYNEKVAVWWKTSDAKEEKIPIEQNKGIFQGPYYHGGYNIQYDSKYKDLDEKQYSLTNKTYGQFLKGKVKVFLALDGSGKVWRLGLKKEIGGLMKSDPDVKKALRAAKSFTDRPDNTWQAQEKKRKLEAAKRKTVLLRISEKFQETLPKKIGEVKHLLLLRHILLTVVTENYRVIESYSKFVWPESKGSKGNVAIAKHISGLNERECWTHIFLAIFFSNADMTNVLNTSNYQELKELLKLFGINPKPFEDAVNKEYAEKAKLKKAKEKKAKTAKAKSKVTTAKIGSKKRRVLELTADTTTEEIEDFEETEDDE